MEKSRIALLRVLVILLIVGCDNHDEPIEMQEEPVIKAEAVSEDKVTTKETTGTAKRAEDTDSEKVEEQEVTEQPTDCGFTQQEADDMQTVNDAIASMLESETFIELDMAGRKEAAESMLCDFVNQGLINDLHFDGESLFSFKYNSGVLGGMQITLDSEKYYYCGEPIN